jgi:hypothetical protein
LGILTPPFNITINGDPTNYKSISENENLTTIYFNYDHSTLEIIIIPEFPSMLMLPLLMMITLLMVTTHNQKHRSDKTNIK